MRLHAPPPPAPSLLTHPRTHLTAGPKWYGTYSGTGLFSLAAVRSDLRAQRGGQLHIMQESDSAAVNPNHLARKVGHTLSHAASALGGGAGGANTFASVFVPPPASRTVVASDAGGGLRVEMPVRGRGAGGARAGYGGGGGGGGMFAPQETVFRVSLEGGESSGWGGARVGGGKGRRRDEENMEGESGPVSSLRAPAEVVGVARARGRGARRARTETGAPDGGGPLPFDAPPPSEDFASAGGGGGGGGGGGIGDDDL